MKPWRLFFTSALHFTTVVASRMHFDPVVTEDSRRIPQQGAQKRLLDEQGLLFIDLGEN